MKNINNVAYGSGRSTLEVQIKFNREITRYNGSNPTRKVWAVGEVVNAVETMFYFELADGAYIYKDYADVVRFLNG
jgi:hypothetical protein